MQVDAGKLSQSPLFSNIQTEDFETVLNCVGGHFQSFAKGAFISLEGDDVRSIGAVVNGRVHLLKEDVFGNRAILGDLGAGEVFGESFICGGAESLTVSIRAAEAADILFLPFERVMRSCPNACRFHHTLVKNMVVMIAQKNIRLLAKLDIATRHSLREKILSYLSYLAQRQNSATVTSPMGRGDLADFLGADRSSLTRELNRLQEEGLLEYDKNTFRLPAAAEKTR